MSTLDDFNRIAFERALVKYNRCRYDDMSTDDWVALVEGYRAQADAAEQELGEVKARFDLD